MQFPIDEAIIGQTQFQLFLAVHLKVRRLIMLQDHAFHYIWQAVAHLSVLLCAVEGGRDGCRPSLLPSPQAREAVSRLENKSNCFTGIHSAECCSALVGMFLTLLNT